MNKPMLALAGALALLAATPSPAPTPLPTPPPLNDQAAPAAAATNQPVPDTGPAAATPTPNAALDDLMKANGAKSTPAPKGTPTPPPNDRKGIEGVWEIQIQNGASTQYEHFTLRQTGTALSGTYLDGGGKKYPLAGSLDGTAIRIVVSMPDGSTKLLEGKLDGTTDMIGMFTDPKESVPFTAAYRPKEKWFDNVNPGAGGLGGGGYGPPK